MNPSPHLVQIQANSSTLPEPREAKRRLEPRHSAPRRLAALLILVMGAAVPAWLAGVTVRRPTTRNIHIEAYRYGFSPSRIFANRGFTAAIACGSRFRPATPARVSFSRTTIYTS